MAGSPGRQSATLVKTSMLERAKTKLFPQYYELTKEAFCRKVAERCAPRLTRRGGSMVADALNDFTVALFRIPAVQAVAFLSVNAPRCPTSLAIEVVMPLASGDDAVRGARREVFAADGRLAERTAALLPTNLLFVDPAGASLATVEAQLQEGWVHDPTLRLLAFATFRRA